VHIRSGNTSYPVSLQEMHIPAQHDSTLPDWQYALCDDGGKRVGRLHNIGPTSVREIRAELAKVTRTVAKPVEFAVSEAGQLRFS
jgi:hypothetical protein